jgi:hypothetical protein
LRIESVISYTFRKGLLILGPFVYEIPRYLFRSGVAREVL